jgi:hypothetical protein
LSFGVITTKFKSIMNNLNFYSYFNKEINNISEVLVSNSYTDKRILKFAISYVSMTALSHLSNQYLNFYGKCALTLLSAA